ncbi:MAG TPA: F0F1 ATP synthase subunit delta [Syntrophomonadaceae bacterium]|nr:F0F1 ATP synthase subunit delta [Syntrophomonadaceae bacterium]HNX28129.1 F0F1 ATP synthase subunit delta [Syntrophomonadaceae bacterium]HPR93468.1 F0F1 ATP synthase subunit delta [Syntrophomonadaceae bacterium]
MLNKSVARRYAEAFFSIARETESIDGFQQELQVVVNTINEMEDLKEYFGHLLIPAKDKKEIAGKIFSGKISSTTLNFLMMVLDKRRQAYLEVILEEYKDMADEVRNITKAELVSAQEVSEAEIKSLAEKLSASTGKKVQLEPKVDPSLLGGIKIRIGDQIMDGTIAKKLEMLKTQLMQAKIS